MQRNAVSAFTRVFDARCGALLNRGGAPAWVPALRCTVKNAAPRPGHGCMASRASEILTRRARQNNPAGKFQLNLSGKSVL